jgi:hypothetical protein
MTQPTTIATRFDVARRTRAYREAMTEVQVRVPNGWPALIALTLAFGFVGSVEVLRGWSWITAVAIGGGGIAVSAIAVWRASCAPIERRLAVVVSTWSGLRGGSGEVQSVARTMLLRDETGVERQYIMSRAALGDALENSIGVATIRSRVVLRFANLDGAH